MIKRGRYAGETRVKAMKAFGRFEERDLSTLEGYSVRLDVFDGPSVICPDTLLPAVCCDPDGSCADGNDGWCCNDIFYCSNDDAEYAEEEGGILCPRTDDDDTGLLDGDSFLTSLACCMIEVKEEKEDLDRMLSVFN